MRDFTKATLTWSRRITLRRTNHSLFEASYAVSQQRKSWRMPDCDADPGNQRGDFYSDGTAVAVIAAVAK
jgi:hypothetical protein